MKGKFAIIGGAFADDQNAERFLDKLRQDGFNASFAGKKGYLQLVAYGFYDSLQEAQTALANIRSSGTGGAWIKRY
jgi:cell division septation protein DedD